MVEQNDLIHNDISIGEFSKLCLLGCAHYGSSKPDLGFVFSEQG
ncbi:hypothetical protein [Desulfosporosinus sp. BICA1-9]|nr:hypothetical protein [Desulfosporosinus sp. BICA1-9]